MFIIADIRSVSFMRAARRGGGVRSHFSWVSAKLKFMDFSMSSLPNENL